MPQKKLFGRTFDARPDRIDFRDRLYQPPLVSLLEQWPDNPFIRRHLADYALKAKLILDQKQEGACTGFGLAAVINYLLWRQSLVSGMGAERVSARMLYHLARIYDEWPGEDYEGSSCRGAMKGWHRHGVCSDKLWPYLVRGVAKFVPPRAGWDANAARRPLGAYYRVNKDSIADMQAAIHEVGAIYVSAAVHVGWSQVKRRNRLPPPVIALPPGALDPETLGGHAFALVGYGPDGFVVQNSWGPTWGFHGFAVLTYEDWVQHGTDAWVAVMGAPMSVSSVPRTRSSISLREVADGQAAWFWRSDTVTRSNRYANPAVQPLSEEAAYGHTVVLENNGRPINHFVDVEDAAAAVQKAAFDLPRDWLKKKKSIKLAVYAHGGLNSEAASLNRIRVVAPYFRENDICPLFITWKTGFLESTEGILEDAVEKFFGGGAQAAGRWLDDLRRQVGEARDRAIEAACENLLVKPVWGQMKQNAAAAAGADGGLTQICRHLKRLRVEVTGLELHLVGHSAGSILFGHLLDQLVQLQLPVASCTLYAPACTVPFALDHYLPAINAHMLDDKSLKVHIMSDEREQADSVGPYGKSLLYLVSRALEDVHKTPLLGMAGVWPNQVQTADMWNTTTRNAVESWRKFVSGKKITLAVHDEKQVSASQRGEMIPLAHGSFDNDIAVVNDTLQRIVGGPLKAQVESLQGF